MSDFLDLFKDVDPEALKRAVSSIPGAESLANVIKGAPALWDQIKGSNTVQETAKGIVGQPIDTNIPNPGNPVSGAVEGAAVGAYKDLNPPKHSGATRSWEAPATETPAAVPDVETPVKPSEEKSTSPSPVEDLAKQITAPAVSSDVEARAAALADAEKKRKLSLIPEAVGGISDAMAMGASAYGVTAPTDTQEKIMARAKENFEKSKEIFESKLRNDPNSDVSKAYRQIVTTIAPELGQQGSFNNMSAQMIGDKLPLIDTMMKAKANETAKKLATEQMKSNREFNVGLKSDQQQAKLEQEHATRLSKVYSNRSGGLGLQDAKVNAAIHSRELIEGARDPSGTVHINQITSPELAMSLASLVSGGNAPAMETIKNMTPEAMSGFIKSKIGFLFGKPVDVLPKAWVDSLTHQLDRQGLTSEALRDQELGALKGLRPTQLDPKTAQILEDNMSSEMPSYSQRYGLKPLDLKTQSLTQPGTQGLEDKKKALRAKLGI
jgi:hypothetical protein